MVYKLKPDRYKARCIICGFAQDMAGVGCTFAPVCHMETAQALLHCANVNGWSLQQIDIKMAFLKAELPALPFCCGSVVK